MKLFPQVFIQQDYDKKGFHIAHYDLRFAKPIDETMLHEVFKNYTNFYPAEAYHNNYYNLNKNQSYCHACELIDFLRFNVQDLA